MKLVRMVLALLFGGRFIATCDQGARPCSRPRASDPGETNADRQLYDDNDEEGW